MYPRFLSSDFLQSAPTPIVDARRGDGKRFIVRADEKLTAFVELETGKEGASGWLQQRGQMTRARSRSSRKLCACVTSRNSSGVR